MGYGHKRVYTEADDIALLTLSCYEYKTLHYMVNRADDRGMCFPTIETIFLGIGGRADRDDRNVHRAMVTLEERGFIAYVRRDEYDPVMRRKMPNVYIINPAYICLPEESELEARSIWAEKSGVSFLIHDDSGVTIHDDSGVTLTSSKNQLQYPESVDLSSVTSSSNNPHLPPNADDAGAESQGDPAAGQDQKARGKGKRAQKPQREAHSRTPQRQPTGDQPAVPTPRSAPPPARQGYPDVPRITGPLADRLLELLAEKVRRIGISIPQARGFIQVYGGAKVEQALAQTHAAVADGKEIGIPINKPGGFFRSTLQGDLTDPLQGVLSAGEAANRREHFDQIDREFDELQDVGY